MNIKRFSEVSLDQVTQELIRDATELAHQVNERRPIPQELIENIQKELLGERVYNSNAIEGNTLTLRETLNRYGWQPGCIGESLAFIPFRTETGGWRGSGRI